MAIPDFFRNVFYKGTNDVNRYRLFELARKCTVSSAVRKAGHSFCARSGFFTACFSGFHEVKINRLNSETRGKV